MAGARGLANEVRTGLDEVAVTASPQAPSKRHPLDEVWMGKSVRQHVKEFGVIFSAIFVSVGAYQLYYKPVVTVGVSWIVGGIIFGLLGYRCPALLLPLWRGWMKLAHYLSIVMTFVILGLAWSIGFIPMAYLLRILGIKRIDVTYRSGVDSYWEKREEKYDDFKRLELQY